MLAKLRCTYVAVGHSERRQYHAETDELCNAKVKAAYRHGLTPILCVGEGLDVRKAGARSGTRWRSSTAASRTSRPSRPSPS